MQNQDEHHLPQNKLYSRPMRSPEDIEQINATPFWELKVYYRGLPEALDLLGFESTEMRKILGALDTHIEDMPTVHLRWDDGEPCLSAVYPNPFEVQELSRNLRHICLTSVFNTLISVNERSGKLAGWNRAAPIKGLLKRLEQASLTLLRAVDEQRMALLQD